MKRFNKQTGGKGELEAKKLLGRKGYEILEMNWGNKWGEVDLICLDIGFPQGDSKARLRGNDGVVVFVEVKAKTGDRYGAPWQMVNRRKLERVRRMGGLYLTEKGWQEKACRIDVVGVVFDSGGKVSNINHYENVY